MNVNVKNGVVQDMQHFSSGAVENKRANKKFKTQIRK
jgi:hypothetical protein